MMAGRQTRTHWPLETPSDQLRHWYVYPPYDWDAGQWTEEQYQMPYQAKLRMSTQFSGTHPNELDAYPEGRGPGWPRDLIWWAGLTQEQQNEWRQQQ